MFYNHTFRKFFSPKKVASFEQIETIINDIIPIQSGRNYRIIKTNFKDIYHKYIQTATNILPNISLGSYSYFLNFLKTQNIHNNPDKQLCPHCEHLSVLSKTTNPLSPTDIATKNKLQIHQNIAKQQLSFYTTLRSNLKDNQLICIMDFSLYQISNDSHQDLIVTFIDNKKREEKEVKKLKRQSNKQIQPPKYNHQPIYYHFVGGAGLKNDIKFVAEVTYKHLISKFLNYIDIHFFTDGGPKHFKITPMINMIHKIAKKELASQHITYHFFASYHGHSICDAAASHAKQTLTKHLNEHQSTPTSTNEICQIISTTKHHFATPIDSLTTPVFKTNTIKNIRSFHKISFVPTLRGFKTSESITGAELKCKETTLYP